VIDVQYKALVGDPIGTIGRIYDHWGVELRPDVEQRMQAFLDDNAQDKHGTHRYSFADTGLEPGDVLDQSRRYREYFDVPSEPER
jgi:hypothetical protein